MIGDDRLQLVETVRIGMSAELPDSRENCKACGLVRESCQSCDIPNRVDVDPDRLSKSPAVAAILKTQYTLGGVRASLRRLEG